MQLAVKLATENDHTLVIPPVLGAVAGATGVVAIFVVLAVALLGGAAVAAVTPFDELAERPDRPTGAPAT